MVYCGRITDELRIGKDLEEAGRDVNELLTRLIGKGNCIIWLDRVANKMKAIISDSPTPALGSTQPPIQWLSGALSPGVKRTGREADHSPPTTVEVKKCGSIYPLPHTPSWRSA
jgi:hypothetical protein